MNFNYSYKAFLITCLLVGNLVLLLLMVELNSGTQEPEEGLVALDYIEEEEVEETPEEQVKITTNSAYNEALKFISEQENSRNENGEVEEEVSEDNISEEEYNDNSTNNDLAISEAKSKLKNVRDKLKEANKTKEQAAASKSVNRRTTISYSLKDRNTLELPNPVYTCASGGKVVINIEVNQFGKVVKAAYNKSASTTSNGCLIDSALEYANKSRFTTAGKINSQLGTISYNFQSQY